jgi:ATP-dependent protease ClpP protease subunit
MELNNACSNTTNPNNTAAADNFSRDSLFRRNESAANKCAPQSTGLFEPASTASQSNPIPVTGVLLVLSSWGGNTYEARALYGLLRALAYPIEIHATGVIQSAATPLMLGADRRTCSPDATFMFHPWAWSTDAHPGRSMDELQQFPLRLDDDIKWAKNVLNERTSLKHADIERLKLFDTGTIHDANFALKNGIVHDVSYRKIPAGIFTWNIA